ncbi:hypothetical protein HELRODRAFT_183841 [Helobdella robusta]|uniref:Uncharacterized protein n=1 Tax=Helobdella robusta TaxID=6412 RepID=T1FK93_HELRO|nr:hypothetical protein HELRODRAFT_183841 [Helobdella robusta]ESO09795.1 hypothetical protein HELRODRAFT_183841 [Helobdella robusta]
MSLVNETTTTTTNSTEVVVPPSMFAIPKIDTVSRPGTQEIRKRSAHQPVTLDTSETSSEEENFEGLEELELGDESEVESSNVEEKKNFVTQVPEEDKSKLPQLLQQPQKHSKSHKDKEHSASRNSKAIADDHRRHTDEHNKQSDEHKPKKGKSKKSSQRSDNRYSCLK